jgi:hypothetical protein
MLVKYCTAPDDAKWVSSKDYISVEIPAIILECDVRYYFTHSEHQQWKGASIIYREDTQEILFITPDRLVVKKMWYDNLVIF